VEIMKIKLLATGQSPTSYTFDGDIVTAHLGAATEEFDLTDLEHGDKFEGVEPDTLELPGSQIIRDAFRDEDGVLHVTLTEASGNGRWAESEWMDAEDYHPANTYIRIKVRDALVSVAPRMVKRGGEWVSPGDIEELDHVEG
jgi:hypothetical protein